VEAARFDLTTSLRYVTLRYVGIFLFNPASYIVRETVTLRLKSMTLDFFWKVRVVEAVGPGPLRPYLRTATSGDVRTQAVIQGIARPNFAPSQTTQTERLAPPCITPAAVRGIVPGILTAPAAIPGDWIPVPNRHLRCTLYSNCTAKSIQ
jgi:hypothetical protein